MSDCVSISITQGRNSIVDAVDADLANFKWYASETKGIYYAGRKIQTQKNKQTSISLHRIILERKIGRSLAKGELVDHVDGDGLNNRRSNLRLATCVENARNRGKTRDNKSGYKGVCWHKGAKKWHAQIRANKTEIHLGYFDNPVDAYAAYRRAAVKYFGEFARFE